jgi:hypothetical protein
MEIRIQKCKSEITNKIRRQFLTLYEIKRRGET